jgi:hypothetical protein
MMAKAGRNMSGKETLWCNKMRCLSQNIQSLYRMVQNKIYNLQIWSETSLNIMHIYSVNYQEK